MKPLLSSLTLLTVPLLFPFSGHAPVQRPRSSPADTATYASGGLKITVAYSRPYKKGRVIFGALVPYNEVWRTGANEPATFTTNKELSIGGKPLPVGTYTLWTTPHADQWQVIFNKRMYKWGINMEGRASRDAAEDALEITVPVEVLPDVTEQFTIRVVDHKVPTLELAWDKVQVSVPLE